MFACLGHFFIHFCIAFYFVIVLSLERAWQIPYHELIGLWTLGSLMIGLFAIPAGMAADRFGAPVTVAVYFLGMGACAVLAGLSESPAFLMLCLTGIGIFAAIYHPAAIPWMVRNSRYRKGKALAVNGIFGSLGGAGAAVVSGLLIDLINWRAAFILPGLAVVATGVLMVVWLSCGKSLDVKTATRVEAEATSGASLIRIFVILMISMFISGLIYNGTQTSLPKMFELRSHGLFGEGLSGVGMAVAIIYGIAGFMQLLGGHLADRYALKTVYLSALTLQIPFLWLTAETSGAYLLPLAVLMVVANMSALPAENMLLARYAPQSRQGLAFGVKFLVNFGAAPIAVQTVAFIQGNTGELTVLFWLLALLGLVAVMVVSQLPRSANA